MPHALVVVQKPAVNQSGEDWKKTQDSNWNTFLKGYGEFQGATARTPEGSQIGEGTWQLNLENALPNLALLIQWCQECKCPYRVLFLDKNPEWIEYPLKQA